MRILVTGGNGFIGAHVLCQLVAEGHDVTCFDLTESSPISARVADDVEFVRGDVTDHASVYDAIIQSDADRIIHLAAILGHPSQARPRSAFGVNVDGTFGILEAATSLGVDRVVAASSAAVYGSVSDDVSRLDETVHRAPSNVYGLTKLVVEHVGSLYQKQYGIEFTAIEPVHGLGPDRRRGNVQDSSIVKAAVAGEPLPVPAHSRPFEIIYVEDEARAFVDAVLAENVPSDRYLIGTGERVTLEEFADIVRERLPEATFEPADVGSDDQLTGLPPTDTTRIRTELGWEPTRTIPEAVDEYVTWLRENPRDWSFDREAVPWPTE